jgi:hypothetical protein
MNSRANSPSPLKRTKTQSDPSSNLFQQVFAMSLGIHSEVDWNEANQTEQ